MTSAPITSIRTRWRGRSGFSPKYTIEDAVRELCVAFRDGRLPNSFDDDIYFNVRRLQRLKAA